MCGIVGYIGNKNACSAILTGLKRLEYRGYDSAGIAVHHRGDFKIVKAVGKVADLERAIGPGGIEGSVGIGHTRWATHGGVTAANAHPQTDDRGTLALVHNGIVENYLSLRAELQKQGVVFASETDTEVAAQLLGRLYEGDPVKAL